MTLPTEPIALLLVMQRAGNIRVMEQMLAVHGVTVTGVSSEDDLAALLKGGAEQDLALVDVTGFGSAAWRMCASLQARNLPFMVLFQPGDSQRGAQSLQYGAMSLLQKPIAKAALLQFIGSWRNRDQNHEGSCRNEHA